MFPALGSSALITERKEAVGSWFLLFQHGFFLDSGTTRKGEWQGTAKGGESWEQEHVKPFYPHLHKGALCQASWPKQEQAGTFVESCKDNLAISCKK